MIRILDHLKKRPAVSCRFRLIVGLVLVVQNRLSSVALWTKKVRLHFILQYVTYIEFTVYFVNLECT